MTMQFTNNNNFISVNKNRILFLIVLFLLSCVRMFGQTSTATSDVNVNNSIEIVTLNQTQTSIATIDSQIDFVGWFMGSRQSQIIENENANQSKSSTKKQILSSGIAPNKVLYRTFMKRVISQDKAIV